MTTPTPDNLPEPFNGLLTGGLTLEDLDQRTRGLDVHLANALGEHVKARHAERELTMGDEQPSVADVAPTIRELASAKDVLNRIGDDFHAGAKAAEEFIANEALDTGQDRVAVPDGETEIIVTPDEKNEWTFEPDTLAEVLANVAGEQFNPWDAPEGLDPEASLRWAYRQGFSDGFATVGEYGSIKWKSTTWKALVGRLMKHEADALASILSRAFDSTKTKTGKIKVTREAYKAGRRR